MKEKIHKLTCDFCGKVKEKGRFASSCEDRACMEKWYEAYKAAQAAALADPRVAAVRADEAVGKGSCSSVDECMEHSELLEELQEAQIKTPYDAVVWARERDGLYWENGLNQLCGDDNPTDLNIKACVKESRERAKLPILASREEVKEN